MKGDRMVFFLGCSRTASKGYMHVLNEHTTYNVTRELHLHKKNKGNTVYKCYQKFSSNKNVGLLAQELENLKNASYWKSDDFVAQKFQKFLEKTNTANLTYWGLVSKILEFDSDQKNKEFCGAKFPLHIAYFPTLKKHFPKSQFVFLARDPLTMAFSQFNKHKMTSFSRRFTMLLYTAIMFNCTILFGNIFRPKNSTFISYENFKADKRKIIQDLCKFLNITFDEEMLDIPVLGSRIQTDSSPYKLSKLESLGLKVFTFPFLIVYRQSMI
ncbi:MAG: sulfotransferase [Cytophagales bacterium]|nr:sulfotransferase [Cytophagales bacterium]